MSWLLADGVTTFLVRKLRLQAQEHTRERDLAEAEVQRLQAELDHAQKEVASVRSSIIIEKRSLEDRLSEERRAKERTQKQFEQRLEAVQAKQSKFRVSSRLRPYASDGFDVDKACFAVFLISDGLGSEHAVGLYKCRSSSKVIPGSRFSQPAGSATKISSSPPASTIVWPVELAATFELAVRPGSVMMSSRNLEMPAALGSPGPCACQIGASPNSRLEQVTAHASLDLDEAQSSSFVSFSLGSRAVIHLIVRHQSDWSIRRGSSGI